MVALDLVFARSRSIVCAAVLAVATIASSPHASQRPSTQAAPSIAAGEVDLHVEMKRLMRRVERSLVDIDELLGNAGAGTGNFARANPNDAAGGAGSFVVRARVAGESVVRDIDRILELADHPHPRGGA